MNKKYLIVLLVAMTCITSCSSIKMSKYASYYYEEAYLASKVIENIERNNPVWFYDCLVETDDYMKYINHINGRH